MSAELRPLPVDATRALARWLVRGLAAGALIAALVVVVSRSPDATDPIPTGAARLDSDHWRARAFAPMDPPIRLPRGRALRDRTQVFVRIEGDGRIDVEAGELVFPPGTVADRVEYRREANRWKVADVRGTRFTSSGERFHAYRPRSLDADALFGAEWPRDDDAGRRGAIALFADAMTKGAGFRRAEPGHGAADRTRSVDRFSRLLDCASCHGHRRPEAAAGEDAHLRRGTDASGMHVFRYVLADRAPLETYRPRDPNADDPFVTYECAGEPVDRATLVGPAGTTAIRCPNGDVPTLRYALADALDADEAHARRVCESRRALAGWMTERAREAYADALATCDVR
ncbi:MAG: hypothetical protein MUE69_22115 [Myxococcota bacterium]|nr:hypothetical protein [Myxococcota bacterium]